MVLFRLSSRVSSHHVFVLHTRSALPAARYVGRLSMTFSFIPHRTLPENSAMVMVLSSWLFDQTRLPLPWISFHDSLLRSELQTAPRNHKEHRHGRHDRATLQHLTLPCIADVVLSTVRTIGLIILGLHNLLSVQNGHIMVCLVVHPQRLWTVSVRLSQTSTRPLSSRVGF